MPFEREVRAVAGAPYGVHMHVTQYSADLFPVDSLLGMKTDGEIVYQHRYTTNFPHIVGPASDAEGRAYIVHVSQQQQPMDFGLGPQMPQGVAPWWGTLVAYSESGIARFAVPIPVDGAKQARFDDIDVSHEGVIVVCGHEQLVSGFVAVWVFEPDGSLRARTRLPEPPLEHPARCAIDEAGRVLLFGPEADLDHPSASVTNPGLVVLDPALDVVAEYVVSRGVHDLDADPRGHFVISSRAPAGTVYVGRHALTSPEAGSTIYATVTAETITPYLVARPVFEDAPTGELVHDAEGVIALHGFTEPVSGVTERPIRSDDGAGAAFLTWDEDGLFTMPVVAPYANETALPRFAGMMPGALVLVDARDGVLYLDTYRTFRTPAR